MLTVPGTCAVPALLLQSENYFLHRNGALQAKKEEETNKQRRTEDKSKRNAVRPCPTDEATVLHNFFNLNITFSCCTGEWQLITLASLRRLTN